MLILSPDFYNIQFSYAFVSFSIFQSVVLQKVKHEIFAFIPRRLRPKHIFCMPVFYHIRRRVKAQSYCVRYNFKLLIATRLHPNISLINFLIKNSVGCFSPLSNTHAQYKHKPSDTIFYQFLHSAN